MVIYNNVGVFLQIKELFLKNVFSMKVHNCLILLGLALFSLGCFAQGKSYDFNGDGKKETCQLEAPKTNDETYDCEGGCNCRIVFSDPKIPAITIGNCIGGKPDILGDLDGNGTTEIGIVPEWWTSCWMSYHIYTFVNGQWTYFVDPITVHCNLFEEHEGPIIEKAESTEGYYKVYYSVFTDDQGIETRTKLVKKKI